MKPFRLFATAVTLVGIGLLVLVLHDSFAGTLAAAYYPGETHTFTQRFAALLLALPGPIHAVFIGQILQKKHLPDLWRRISWVGISVSGLWLGAALAYKNFGM